jgi:hypothetical protein
MLGCHMRITNPISRGYYGYLACVDSWSKAVDKVVVVDGCSTDDSIAMMGRWCAQRENIITVRSEETHWGDTFGIEQSLINKQIGHENLKECDWIFGIDADHVLEHAGQAAIEEILNSSFRNELCVSFEVKYVFNGHLKTRTKPRSWILNNRLIRLKGLSVGWGIDEETGPTDNPIEIKGKSIYVDPVTGVKKLYNIGKRIDATAATDISAVRCGHFFFTAEQALANIRRWEDALSRKYRREQMSNIERRLVSNLVGIRGRLTKEELLNLPLPIELQRVIDTTYHDTMLGGALYSSWVNPARNAALKVLSREKTRMVFRILTNLTRW